MLRQFILITFLYSQLAQAAPMLLCGSDEDGCYDYRDCACIPYNEEEASKPFCLDFDKPSCYPLSQKTNCYYLFIYKNQAECLATIFQSEPRPPCQLVSKDFCLTSKLAICDADGFPGSCKYQ